MNAASQRRLTPILAVFVLLLAGLWLWLLFGLGRNVRWNAAHATSLPPMPNKPASLPVPASPEEFAPVWQQSLFSPDRKPEAHAVSGGSDLGDLKLTGIILTPQLRMALLHDNKDNKELRAREGESLPDGSTKVVEVKRRSVILDSSQGRMELKLPAGAPITMNASAPSPSLPSPSGPGLPPMKIPPGLSPQQAERLRQLEAAILQRRAASQVKNPEGAH